MYACICPRPENGSVDCNQGKLTSNVGYYPPANFQGFQVFFFWGGDGDEGGIDKIKDMLFLAIVL